MELGLAIQIARSKTREAYEYVQESIPVKPHLLMEIDELLSLAIKKMDQYLEGK